MIAGTSGLWGIARKRRQAMKKMMLLVAMLTMMMLASPALAQNDKAAKQAQKAAKAEAKAAKAAQKGDKMKEMPKTGGVPINASLLGLGAGALLVGGGLLVRKVTR
jgi:LPXTG-motif cell wall-anchored protein